MTFTPSMMESSCEPGFVSPMGSVESLRQTLSTSRHCKPILSRNSTRGTKHRTSTLSLGGVSSASDLSEDDDYVTDNTTPALSESGPDYGDEVEDFRDREYPQLKGKVYLDHGGTTLYAKSLIEDFSADLISNLYGNPHSASSPSALAGHRVDAIREKALRFFNADPEQWDLVFVANATAAIKLVIDCFRDHAAASNTPVWYGYHRDAHTSLVGVREITKMHRCFTSDEEVDTWINSGGLGGPRARQLGLFAYPGQSNMTGRRLPLTWPGRIRKSFHKAATYTLLDAAALASTAALDLSDVATAPDFVALSFYKIFGFPNIGALLVRKDSQHVLEDRRYFGGGTVDMIITINDTWHAKKETALHDRLEDGTLPFHSIFALDHAIDVHERLYGPNPMQFISHHTAQLAKQLYDGLANMKHMNGQPVAIIYKDRSAVYGDPSVQGATLAFNIRRPDGSIRGYEDVEEAADEQNIFLRSGSLCNPGGVANYLNWSPADMKAAYASGHRCSQPTQVIHGKPTGVVRASLGAMSTAGDVLTFLHFISETYLDTDMTQSIPDALGLPAPHFLSQSKSFNSPSVAPSSKSAYPPSLYIAPNKLVLPSAPPSAAPSMATSIGTHSDSSIWGDVNPPPLPLPSTEALQATAKTDTPTAPPLFLPSHYHPSTLRRNMTDASIHRKNFAQVGMEIQLSQYDENIYTHPHTRNHIANNPSSLKSGRRIFGRSVTSLLHRRPATGTVPALPGS